MADTANAVATTIIFFRFIADIPLPLTRPPEAPLQLPTVSSWTFADPRRALPLKVLMGDHQSVMMNHN
jgi:hypothetical protein